MLKIMDFLSNLGTFILLVIFLHPIDMENFVHKRM